MRVHDAIECVQEAVCLLLTGVTMPQYDYCK